MLLKKLLNVLDLFLPEQLPQDVGAALLYRGRIVVATNLVSIAACLILFMAVLVLNLSVSIKFAIICSILTLGGHLFCLKKYVKNFEQNLLIGATIQVLVINIMVYFSAFSEKGMGFFGLIWLMPVFLMVAFYFDTHFSFLFSLLNFCLFLGMSFLKYPQFYSPINDTPHFSITFFIFLTIVIVFNYSLAFIFVFLSEELQREVIKQRDLLEESAKFQSLGQMASTLAHDINNPLFTIQGKLHQMRNLLSRDQLDLEKCDQIVESVETTILKLSQMVKGISTFAREGRGDQMVSVSVAELLESNLALAIDRIKSSGIELEISIDPSAHLICYPSFISRVILNLLNNAIDALESAQTKKIEVKAWSEKNWINISVTDTGGGVSKDLEKKIFEPFFTTKTLGKGTGLGLSISKGLAEVHEGGLIYQRIDQKTVFLLKIPSYE